MPTAYDGYKEQCYETYKESALCLIHNGAQEMKASFSIHQ